MVNFRYTQSRWDKVQCTNICQFLANLVSSITLTYFPQPLNLKDKDSLFKCKDT